MKRLGSLVLPVALLLAACSKGGGESAASADTFEGLLKQGQEAHAQGQYSKALEIYQKALEKQPGSAVAYNLIGMAYRFQYNMALDASLKKKEIAAFQKAIELQPDFVVALVNLGATHYYQGQKKEAAVYFQRALEKVPNHPEAAELKKMIAEGEGEPAPAQPTADPPAPPPPEPKK
jgi:tetratricopeptide (TPR) repeat protein